MIIKFLKVIIFLSYTLISLETGSLANVNYRKSDLKASEEKSFTEKNINKLTEQAEREILRLNYLKAKRIYQKILSNKKKIYEPFAEEIAITYNDLGLMAYRLGEIYKSEEYFLKSSEIIKKYNNENTAEIFTNLGLIYTDLGSFKKADSFLQKGKEINKRIFGADSDKYAISLNQIGNNYISQEIFSEGKKYFTEALNIFNKNNSKDYESISIVHQNLGYIYIFAGEYNKAVNTFLEAIEILEKNKKYELATINNIKSNLGLTYTYQGKYKEAELIFLDILKGFKKDSLNIESLTYLSNLALIYIQLGSYEKAEKIQLNILEKYNQIFGDKPTEKLGTYLGNIAYNYYLQGFFEDAEKIYLKSLEVFEDSLLSESSVALLVMNNLARLYDDQGFHSKALNYYQKINDLYNKKSLNNHPDYALNLNNIAMAYNYLEQDEKVEPLLLEALELAKNRLSIDHELYNLINTNLAFFYSKQGIHDKAESLVKNSIVNINKNYGEYHPFLNGLLATLAQIYINQEYFNKAKPTLLKAIKISEKNLGYYHPDLITLLTTLSDVYSTQGFYKKEEKLLERALEITEKAFGKNHTNKFSILDRLASNNLSQKKYEKSISLLEDSLRLQFRFIRRESALIPLSRRSEFVESFGYAYERAFSFAEKNSKGKELALFSRINKQGLLQEIEKRQANILDLDQSNKDIIDRLKTLTTQISKNDLNLDTREKLLFEKEKLEEQLYFLLPEIKDKVVEVEDIASVIPDKGILIEFQKYEPFVEDEWKDPRYLSLILEPINTPINVSGKLKNYKIHVKDLGPASIIDDQIKKSLIATENIDKDAIKSWNKVGDLVINPLQEYISNAKTIYISPDGEINRIPFYLLNSYDAENLLVKTKKIIKLTTGRELLELAQNKKMAKNMPLILANPKFEKKRRKARYHNNLNFLRPKKRYYNNIFKDWSQLPGTALEGEKVSKIIKSKLLTKDDATAIAVMNYEGPEILHIASHSFFISDDEFVGDPLLRSGVVLAGANNSFNDNKDDGYLTALEFSKLNLRGTELVVISGCESGVGEINIGEGVYGLKRAITVAGSRSSLLSLWPVSDFATVNFMIIFYENLINGLGKYEALSMTQEFFRNHPNKQYRHPFYWAAFQLSGDWRPINNK